MFEGINEVAIVVSAILAIAVGNVWYSPLVFGNVWMRAIGIQSGSDVLPQREMMIAVVRGVFAQMLFFVTLSFLMKGVDMNVYSLMEIAGLVTLLVATQSLGAVIWERKPFAYFLVQVGYSAVIIFGGLAVITYWPW